MEILNQFNLIGSGWGWVGGVITLLVGGSFLPALITVFINLLRLPAIKQTCGGFCFGLGKSLSFMATKRLGKLGRNLEDGLQEMKNYCNGKFDAGLDSDDK